jgi:class 3 adenylate cyclase
MTASRIVLVDNDADTAGALLAELGRCGLNHVAVVPTAALLAPLLTGGETDVVIVNHRYRQDGALAACNVARRLAPNCATLVATAAGPALAQVRTWARESLSVDVIVEKPFVGERFYRVLTDLLASRASTRESPGRAERLANLLPAGALATVDMSADAQAELFDAAVLFTDIRESTRLITRIAPQQYFELLNTVLSEQTACIQAAQGSVVKYTGDGVMAVFRGMGRSYLALRCGLELAAMSSRQRLPFGVGVAQGLVLAGLIGDARRTGRRRQFDVIGATAHLAARLCAHAEPGELVATNSINAVARVHTPVPRPIQKLPIRGFDSPIDCVAFKPEAA